MLAPTDWDSAQRVARRIRRPQRHPDSVAFVSAKCTNEENYLQKIARGLVGTNNVDHCARL
jgi:predicted molibdopterin-dependent oxidoreductase YjgC